MNNKTHYINGQIIKSQKGDSVTHYFKTGKIRAKGKVISGLMEGKWIFNREPEQLWQIGHFKKGKKNGPWVRYDKRGKLEYEETFKDDKKLKK